jgi:hypothetical protein
MHSYFINEFVPGRMPLKRSLSARLVKTGVCVCVPVSVCVSVCACVHTHTYIYTCMHTDLLWLVCTYMCIHMYSCVHTIKHIYIYSCEHAYQPKCPVWRELSVQKIQPRMHANMYRCMHTYIWSWAEVCQFMAQRIMRIHA